MEIVADPERTGASNRRYAQTLHGNATQHTRRENLVEREGIEPSTPAL